MSKNPDIIVHCEIVEGSTGGRVYGKTYKIQLELQNKLNKIISYLEGALNENKLPNGENADIGYWEYQCKDLLQIAKGTEK